MAELSARELTLAYDGHIVVEGLDLQIKSNCITALVGPNGSGKSTLLRGLARLMKPTHGAAYLDHQAIDRMSTRLVARQMAMLPQQTDAPAGLTVRELVSYGRFPYQGLLGTLNQLDHGKIEEAMELAGVTSMADRCVEELSGGQKQLAWIAMALAQDTDVLLLDEPTTFLDLAHQLDVLEVLHRLHQSQGRTIAMVLHDINQAARYASHMIAMKDGRVTAEGSPTEIVTATVMANVFEIEAEILLRDQSTPYCIPISRIAKPTRSETEFLSDPGTIADAANSHSDKVLR